jgi:hypothetical protein
MPDDAGHLVAVHLDDRILHCDLRHGGRALAFARANVWRRKRNVLGAGALWRAAPRPARAKHAPNCARIDRWTSPARKYTDDVLVY